MAKGRRGSWPGLGVALLALFFVLYTPTGDRLYRAPSPSALWMSRHRALGPRLPELATQPVPQALALAGGLDEDDLQDLRDDPATRFWYGHLLSGDALLVHEPFLGPSGEKGWVVVSHVGWRHAHLRLISDLGVLKRWQRIGSSQGRSLWMRRSKSKRSTWVLALRQGTLVAVRHPNPLAIHEVLARLDGQIPHLAAIRPDVADWQRQEQHTDDEGRWMGGPFLSSPVNLRMETGADLLVKTDGAAIHDVLSWTPSPETRAFASRFAGAQVLATARIPPHETRPGGQLFVMAPPYSTLVSFLGVPSLVWISPATDAADAFAQARRLVKEAEVLLEQPWSEDARDPNIPVFVPEDPLWVAALGERSRPAATYLEGHLVLAFGRQTLERLLLRHRSEQARFEERDVRWNDDNGLFWMDVAKSLEVAQPFVLLAGLQNPTPEQAATGAGRGKRVVPVLNALQSLRIISIAKTEGFGAEGIGVVLTFFSTRDEIPH